MQAKNYINIGQAAKRCGVTASALRFYESRGLIQSQRGSGNQRRYHRAMIRRISLIKVAQSLGLSLKEISNALDTLPDKESPTRKDWQRLSRSWRDQLEQRIQGLEMLKDKLDGCIGCGCLSLKRCALYNKDDVAGDQGSGPRYLIAD